MKVWLCCKVEHDYELHDQEYLVTEKVVDSHEKARDWLLSKWEVIYQYQPEYTTQPPPRRRPASFYASRGILGTTDIPLIMKPVVLDDEGYIVPDEPFVPKTFPAREEWHLFYGGYRILTSSDEQEVRDLYAAKIAAGEWDDNAYRTVPAEVE